MEHGEKNTKYFFNLEKRRKETSSVSKIIINDIINENPNDVSKYVARFYQTLYSSAQPCPRRIQLYLDNLSNNIKKIDTDFKNLCEDQITIAEIKHSIKGLKDNRSPGNDGLNSEFYKAFSEELARFLLSVFNESLRKKELPASLKQGVITLIPKPNKEKLHIDNWRPITLLNNDCKIFALIFGKRLKAALENIIDEEQSGFMSGRNIHNNIRLILDMIDYEYFIPDESLILFIDFYKAFDTIEHGFIFKVIEFLGFGDFFLNAIQTLYNGCNSSVKMSHGTTQRFQLQRGLKQGCPVSPFLFLLATQVMSSHIKMSHFQGISALRREFKICQ